MKKSLLILSLLVLGTTAHALDKCPVEFGNGDYLEQVSQKITEAGSCWEASEIADACALGASGDVYTVGSAIARCEQDMPVMSQSDAAMYSTLNNKCTEKYSKLEGTMYMSMNAFCHLQVTRLFLDFLSHEE
jgi:hypothetical protein